MTLLPKHPSCADVISVKRAGLMRMKWITGLLTTMVLAAGCGADDEPTKPEGAKPEGGGGAQTQDEATNGTQAAPEAEGEGETETEREAAPEDAPQAPEGSEARQAPEGAATPQAPNPQILEEEEEEEEEEIAQ